MGATEEPAPMAGGVFAWPLDGGQYATMQLVDTDVEPNWDYHGMPTNCPWATTAMVEIEDCAGQVSTQATSWSAVKRLYD